VVSELRCKSKVLKPEFAGFEVDSEDDVAFIGGERFGKLDGSPLAIWVGSFLAVRREHEIVMLLAFAEKHSVETLVTFSA
jgi:hypothetical protein